MNIHHTSKVSGIVIRSNFENRINFLHGAGDGVIFFLLIMFQINLIFYVALAEEWNKITKTIDISATKTFCKDTGNKRNKQINTARAYSCIHYVHFAFCHGYFFFSFYTSHFRQNVDLFYYIFLIPFVSKTC